MQKNQIHILMVSNWWLIILIIIAYGTSFRMILLARLSPCWNFQITILIDMFLGLVLILGLVENNHSVKRHFSQFWVYCTTGPSPCIDSSFLHKIGLNIILWVLALINYKENALCFYWMLRLTLSAGSLVSLPYPIPVGTSWSPASSWLKNSVRYSLLSVGAGTRG